jgi:hypothetical protein
VLQKSPAGPPPSGLFAFLKHTLFSQAWLANRLPPP